ncbi:2,5-diamino-6-(ribosylamino)-4(3H)-pyrimidinone 5'-phosphate reductase [Halobacteriales archaeon QS_8_69_26]|nr:MAG: 2,5-diamino-6-(ribosylamino)-4(3H)-pyrimidinone 5'-phosphate reductase [Halobacteriales archaeon QS_8_69_26]
MRVVVNAAVSADGKLSTRHREQVAISGAEDFARVDRLRADGDAVVVGVGTVLADDPHLTLDDGDLRADREDRGDPPNPARVVADSRARTPPDARIVDDAARTYLLVADAAPGDRVADLEANPTVEVIRAGEDRVDLPVALDRLEAEGVEQLMVEGGGELIFSLFAEGLVDDLSVFVGPTVIGGREAPTLADGEGFVDPEAFPELRLTDTERIDGGIVLHWTVAEG